jgi:hypothetical protein
VTSGSVALPTRVEEACASLLELMPDGLVTGLYLRGGLGFGEWVPGQSDVDFVATLTRRPDASDLEALRATHEAMARRHPDLHVDGSHLLATDLAEDPATLPDVPVVLGRHFDPEATLHEAMVVWHELARHGVTVSGPPLESVPIWTSQPRLLDFTRDNLDTYWRGNAEALLAMPTEGAREEACCWCVLGVARLDHLLVTGDLTTKSAAGRWGLTHYPERFHRVLREALRIRDGGPDEYVDARDARGRDTADFTSYVVETGTGRGLPTRERR